MPHCVIECSADIDDIVNLDDLLISVHDTTEASGLFSKGDVKARLMLSDNYVVGGSRQHYVHVVCSVLSGRTLWQRKKLADSIASKLCELLPTVEMLSVQVNEIDNNTYSNKRSIVAASSTVN